MSPSPSSSSESSPSTIIPHIIGWLDKRKKPVPDALLSLSSSASSASRSIDDILYILPGLRERERRALVRHVEKCINDEEFKSSNKKKGSATSDMSSSNFADDKQRHVLSEEGGSDGEYDIRDCDPALAGNDDNGNVVNDTHDSSWPLDVEFSNNYRWDARVPDEVKDKYCPRASASSPVSSLPSFTEAASTLATSSKRSRGTRQRASHRSKTVYYQKIIDPDHPAYGEYGLYCAVPDGAPPGTWLLDYIGHISLGEHQDNTSNYVSDFGVHGELSVDAATFGNESRFLNDYRNTGRYANVEFKLRWDACGELRQGVYVKQKKDSRNPNFSGVAKDEELLVSYGRTYWRSRVGNLTDFVWRLPGMPMPDRTERNEHPDGTSE
ncbi:hypothetical protein ACHAXH_001727, partial [Discostella pseudostelligera]